MDRRKLRNLFLRNDYQMVFTAVLVLSCAVIMVGLGWLVLHEADVATRTAIANVKGGGLDPDVAAAMIKNLDGRRDLFGWILAGVGVALTVGLFVYGLNMTHHVAGPLLKIAYYCDRVVDGKFAELTSLRRRDQLVDLYGAFKEAYEGVRQRQLSDVEMLRAVVVAADAAKVGDSDPEAAAALAAVRELLRAKEVTLG